MWDKFKGWYADPFDGDMDVTDWFLFIGLVIVAMILWRIILAHILEGVRSVT